MGKIKRIFGGIGQIAKAAGSLGVNASKAYGKLLKTVYWTLPYNTIKISDEMKEAREYSPDIGKLEKYFTENMDSEKVAEEIEAMQEKAEDKKWKYFERAVQTEMWKKLQEMHQYQTNYYREAAFEQSKRNQYWKGGAQQES